MSASLGVTPWKIRGYRVEKSALPRGNLGVTPWKFRGYPVENSALPQARIVAQILAYLSHWSIVIGEFCASNLAEEQMATIGSLQVASIAVKKVAARRENEEVIRKMLRIDHAQSGISCGSKNESAGFWSASALNHGFCEKQGGGGNSRKRFEFQVSSFRRKTRDNSSCPLRELLLLVLSCCFRLAARSSAAWEAQKIGLPRQI